MARFRRVLGDDDPDTLASANNRLWTVALDWDGSIKQIIPSLVEFLVELESVQLWHGSRDVIFSVNREDLYAVAKRYKIWRVGSMEPTEMHPPGYYLMPAFWGGSVPATSSLAEFAENRLRSESLAKSRTQLNRNLITAVRGMRSYCVPNGLDAHTPNKGG